MHCKVEGRAGDGGLHLHAAKMTSTELFHLLKVANEGGTMPSTCFHLLWLGQHVVASLCLDLVDNVWVNLDLVCFTTIVHWHLDATKSFANWCQDRILLESRDTIVSVGD